MPMGFSRQEYWSGVPLPSPLHKLEKPIYYNPDKDRAKKNKIRKEKDSYRYRRDSEKAIATHSSTLAWQIPWMEEPGGLQSMGSLRVGRD